MKSARRHELQKNELADQLEKLLQSLGNYWKWIGVGVLAAGVVLVVATLIVQRQRAAAGRAWAEYLAASSTTNSLDRDLALRDVANVYAGTPAALWATIDQADANLNTGCQLLFRAKDEGQKLLRQAITGYELALGQAKDPSLIQRLYYSIGQAHEALGELKQAREAYEQARARGEKTAIGLLAKEKLDLLARDDIEKFYDWFVAQRPVAAGGSTQPNNLLDLPATPNITLPSNLSESGSPSGENSPGATESPASPPAGSPSETPPVSEKPETPSAAPNAPATPNPPSSSEGAPRGADAANPPAASSEPKEPLEPGGAESKSERP